MSIEFKLPELGENIESADIVSVLVKPVDMLEKDQSVIEIETDKATIEVPSTIEGLIKEVLVKPGQKINVGAVLLTVDDNKSTASDSGIAATQEKKAKDSQTPEQAAKLEAAQPDKAAAIPV